MNYNNYTVTMPYNKLEEWQKIEEKYNNLKKAIENCYDTSSNDGNVYIDITKLKKIAIDYNIISFRYHDCNFTEVK